MERMNQSSKVSQCSLILKNTKIRTSNQMAYIYKYMREVCWLIIHSTSCIISSLIHTRTYIHLDVTHIAIFRKEDKTRKRYSKVLRDLGVQWNKWRREDNDHQCNDPTNTNWGSTKLIGVPLWLLSTPSQRHRQDKTQLESIHWYDHWIKWQEVPILQSSGQEAAREVDPWEGISEPSESIHSSWIWAKISTHCENSSTNKRIRVKEGSRISANLW
jgi:hypothetical protein